jgi:hypothetical protein
VIGGGIELVQLLKTFSNFKPLNVVLKWLIKGNFVVLHRCNTLHIGVWGVFGCLSDQAPGQDVKNPIFKT